MFQEALREILDHDMEANTVGGNRWLISPQGLAHGAFAGNPNAYAASIAQGLVHR